MAFFEEIGKKITQTSQGAIQKTRELAESVKISSNISDEEKKINEFYLQIGKTYYNKHTANPEEEFVQLFSAIRESQMRINDLSEQVKQLKGGVKCPLCGEGVPTGSSFCAACGCNINAAPTQAPPENTAVCPNCGAAVPAGTSFCTYCGAKIAQG